MSTSKSRSRTLKAAMVAVVALGVVAAFAVARGGATGGDRWARYAPISTPAVVSTANRETAALITRSLGAIALRGTERSKTLVEDAGGKRFGGGQRHRETDYDVPLLLGKPPYYANLNVWGWGSPSGQYRLDATLISPFASVSSPISGVALDPSAVREDRARLSQVYSDIFSAIGIPSDYDAAQLARDSAIRRYNDGPEITMAGVLLPPRSSAEETGSLVVMLSGGWALESVYVYTGDDSFYYDVVNGHF